MKYVIKFTDKLLCLSKTAKFTSCNVLKYYKIRYKSRGNNLIELYKLCTAGSLWRICKFSDIHDIGIMPGDRLC